MNGHASTDQPRGSWQNVTASGSSTALRSAAATSGNVTPPPPPPFGGLRVFPSHAVLRPSGTAARRSATTASPPAAMATSTGGRSRWSMVAPLCSVWSRLAWTIRAVTVPAAAACFSAPPRSTQSSDTMTSAATIASHAARPTLLNGSTTWRGWSVGNIAPVLRSVITAAPSRSASSTRSAHASCEREPRPNRISGRCADASSSMVQATASRAGRGAADGANRARSGHSGASSSLAS